MSDEKIPVITSEVDGAALERRNEKRRFTFIVALLSADTLLIFVILFILIFRR